MLVCLIACCSPTTLTDMTVALLGSFSFLASLCVKKLSVDPGSYITSLELMLFPAGELTCATCCAEAYFAAAFLCCLLLILSLMPATPASHVGFCVAVIRPWQANALVVIGPISVAYCAAAFLAAAFFLRPPFAFPPNPCRSCFPC